MDYFYWFTPKQAELTLQPYWFCLKKKVHKLQCRTCLKKKEKYEYMVFQNILREEIKGVVGEKQKIVLGSRFK